MSPTKLAPKVVIVTSNDEVPIKSAPSAAVTAAVEEATLLAKIQSSKLTDLCDSRYARKNGFAALPTRKRKIKSEPGAAASSSNEYSYKAKIANTANDNNSNNFMNSSSSRASYNGSRGGSSSSSSKAKAAPQVHMVDGDIRVLESSLVLNTDTSTNPNIRSSGSVGDYRVEEMVEVSHSSATYASFLNRKGSSAWGLDETRLFYQCLRQCGLDFTVMQSFFPNRTRKQLKLKFFREEKNHYDLVMQALQSWLPLDISPFDGVSVKGEDGEADVEDRRRTTSFCSSASNAAGSIDMKFLDSDDDGETLEI